jgi:N-acetylmuramic acid 6-phosphate etherase
VRILRAVSTSESVYLGIEGGGTRTTVIASDGRMQLLGTKVFAPGNVRLLNNAELDDLFITIGRFFPRPAAIGIGMAGARDSSDRERIRQAMQKVWGKTPVVITHDLEIALRAEVDPKTEGPAVLVLSGTGSCCYGQNPDGLEAKVGGWGHILGDRGSGYDIAISAIKSVISEYDRAGKWTYLGQEILRALVLNEPNELIAWIQHADKAAVAALAQTVFEAAKKRSSLAKHVLTEASERLAQDAVICAERLSPLNRPVSFLLAGGVLRNQKGCARSVAKGIEKRWPKAKVRLLKHQGAWGAVKLAVDLPADPNPSGPLQSVAPHAFYVPTFDAAESPTEQRNPASFDFHRLSIAKQVDRMLSAEEAVIPALIKERKKIEKVVQFASETLKKGGRVFYAGAGTSGRLGVLDASECPPTFRAAPDMIQGLIAGGQRALWQAVEGAEDDASAGANAVKARGAGKGDLLIGIAASGRTSYVWGALAQAKVHGAKTILLCFNPNLKIEQLHRPDLVIAPNLGPEILTGSTRLKCGTATKLLLNIISTIAMTRVGKVISNLMVDLNPSNVKLRDRAIRIVQELTGCGEEKAKQALEENAWVVKKAWTAIRKAKQRRIE